MHTFDAQLTQSEKWDLIIGSLIGGLPEYSGIVKWLSMFDNLDDAFEAAMRLRDGMVAT